MNKGTLISFCITLFTITQVIDTHIQIETFYLPALQMLRNCTDSLKGVFTETSATEIPATHTSQEPPRCIKPCITTPNTALQTTVDQIVQHVNMLIEGRPNSKRNIVAHLAAIISSIINLIAKMASSQSKQRDFFYHELNAKLQKALAECASEEITDESALENTETH